MNDRSLNSSEHLLESYTNSYTVDRWNGKQFLLLFRVQLCFANVQLCFADGITFYD